MLQQPPVSIWRHRKRCTLTWRLLSVITEFCISCIVFYSSKIGKLKLGVSCPLTMTAPNQDSLNKSTNRTWSMPELNTARTWWPLRRTFRPIRFCPASCRRLHSATNWTRTKITQGQINSEQSLPTTVDIMHELTRWLDWELWHNSPNNNWCSDYSNSHLNCWMTTKWSGFCIIETHHLGQEHDQKLYFFLMETGSNKWRHFL